jgi:hypothetical protein
LTPNTNEILLGGFSTTVGIAFKIHQLIFLDYPLGYGEKIKGKTLEVSCRANKFPVGDSDTDLSKIPVSCTIRIEAGDVLLDE